jgi:serine protease Do
MSELRGVLLLASVLLLAWPCPARAGERVEVELQGGDRLEGELLRRDEERLLLLVGGRVLELEPQRIKAVRGAATAGPEALDAKRLYTRGRLALRDMQSLVRELGPAIALVKTPAGLGTGWLCHPDGFLVTNHHVVAGERNIRVTFFPREGRGLGRKVFRKVRIVALNAQMDLALLKIEEPLGFQAPGLVLGDSGALSEGERVFAIGNPLGLERSASQGIVSKLARNLEGRLYVQTTAPIAPGNSGGPLLTERGEVIGVVSRGAIMLDGLGFAIPSSTVMEFLDNVEAFAYDEDNPNTGVAYMEVPVSTTDRRVRFDASEFLRRGPGLCCLAAVDLDGDGRDEVVFADNVKSELGVVRWRKRQRPAERGEFDWDINRVPEGELFQVETQVVASRVTALAAGDLDGDRRPDLVFHGDVDGLAMLRQEAGGGFAPTRRLEQVPAVGLSRAIRLADLDRDGRTDVVVLGQGSFSVLWGGERRTDHPLHAALRSRVLGFELVDADRDGRLDVVFFAPHKHYGASVRLQGADGRFTEEVPLATPLSGPAWPFGEGKHRGFVTLDAGINRVRELRLAAGQAAAGQAAPGVLALPLTVEAGGGALLSLGPLADGGPDALLTADPERHEFVLFTRGKAGVTQSRSPSPEGLAFLRLARSARGPLVLSFSPKEKLLGVSRVRAGRVTFPRPVATADAVQDAQLELLPDLEAGGPARPHLVWIEKAGAGHAVRACPVEALGELAFAGGEDARGALAPPVRSLAFSAGAGPESASLAGRPRRLVFADFDRDGQLDLMVFWAYSGKQSLYRGLGRGRFREAIREQALLDPERPQALLFEDLDGDGRAEVLEVRPGFVRVLGLDTSDRLVAERQVNFPFGKLDQLLPLPGRRGEARFAARAGHGVEIVRLGDGDRFERVSRLDLAGLELDTLAVSDLDGQPELVSHGRGLLQIIGTRPGRFRLESEVLLDAGQGQLTYWNLFPVDLDRDGVDELLLFDKQQSVIEVLGRGADGKLDTAMRHKLFDRQLANRPEAGQTGPDEPREVIAGDFDGNGKPDLAFLLHDRLVIYLQAAKAPPSRAGGNP